MLAFVADCAAMKLHPGIVAALVLVVPLLVYLRLLHRGRHPSGLMDTPALPGDAGEDDTYTAMAVPVAASRGNLTEFRAEANGVWLNASPLVPDPQYSGALAPEPVLGLVALRATRDALLTAHAGLIASFPRTGIWPVVLVGLDQQFRPWMTGELEPRPSQPWDPEDVLRKGWADSTPEGDDADGGAEPRPLGRPWPGLAAPRPWGAAVPMRLQEVWDTAGSEARLGAIAVTRPANIVGELGWNGAVNFDLDPWAISAVLRSWEDRFGVVLVALGFDTLTFCVPPNSLTDTRAQAFAAEVFALCPDSVSQGAGSIADLATSLEGASSFTLWWD